MNRADALSRARGIWFGWPITHRLEDWRVTLDWMADLGFNTLVYPVYYEWNALAHLDSLPEMMAANVVRATYWSPSRGKTVSYDGPPPMSAPGAFPALLAEAAHRGIEVWPLITSFGHNYLLVAAYPETGAQGRPDPCDVPCTSVPQTYERLYRMYDDVLAQYPHPPPYVHVAMDEQWGICRCPACAAKGPVQVYVDHLSAVHGYLDARGVRMIAFDDMLRPAHGQRHGYLDDAQIAQILDAIPRDIVMHLWHYSTPIEKDAMAAWVDWFAGRGFDVCLCPGHHVGRAQTLFDATPNARTMLAYGLEAAPGASVIAYSPHLFPQEPYYHALAHRLRTGDDDGAARFLETALGDRAERVAAALAEVTTCVAQLRRARGLHDAVGAVDAADATRRTEIADTVARMAQAADDTLRLLDSPAPSSPQASRLAASFHLARTVASRYAMAHALVEGRREVRACLDVRDLAAADRAFGALRAALEEGLCYLDAALRAIEPVLDWDRHVHRVLCLLTEDRACVQDLLRALEGAQRNVDNVLHHRSSWPWPQGW
jgi:hypothetical protein